MKDDAQHFLHKPTMEELMQIILDGVPVQQIADDLGIPSTRIWTYVNRNHGGVKKLRTRGRV